MHDPEVIQWTGIMDTNPLRGIAVPFYMYLLIIVFSIVHFDIKVAINININIYKKCIKRFLSKIMLILKPKKCEQLF